MLNAAATEALGMVLHELVTNATKYGALSVPEGRVSVDWECRHKGDTKTDLLIVWRETGGPPVSAPSHDGYGNSLVCGLIPHELGGTVDLVFASDGVCCSIGLPVKAVTVTEQKGSHFQPSSSYSCVCERECFLSRCTPSCCCRSARLDAVRSV